MGAEGKRPLFFLQDQTGTSMFLRRYDVRWDGFTGSLEDAVNEGVRRAIPSGQPAARVDRRSPEFARKNPATTRRP